MKTKKKQCTRWRPYRNFSPFSAFVDPLRRVKTPPCDQRVSLLREVSSWMGRLAFVTANNPVSPREKKKKKKKKRKRENGKQRHAQGVEKWARAQRRPSERDYEMNLLTAAAAAAVVEAREHNDSGRQRRTLFTSPLRVPSSLHRMARIGVRAHCYT